MNWLSSLPPEIAAAIAAGITSIIAAVIRWVEMKIFKNKLTGKTEENAQLMAQLDELKKLINRS